MSPFATLEIIRQGPPQAACLGLAGCSPVWPSRPQAAYPCAPAARGADKGRDPQSGQGPHARRLNCGPAGARGAARARPRRGAADERPEARGPGLAAGTPRGAAAATPARRAGPEGRTAPQPPLCVGRAAPEHLRRDRRGGGAGQGRAERAPQGLGLAARRGAPEQRRRLAWPEPPQAATSRHITPTAAGGRGGRRQRRPGRAGERPAGRWGREGRPRGPDGSPHHRPQAVAPLVRSPGAGRPGAMKCGQRREPLSECGHGLHSGRAAGATARKPPPRSRAAGPLPRPPAPLGPVLLLKADRLFFFRLRLAPAPALIGPTDSTGGF